MAGQSRVVGKDITRVDGILKVTGAAQYGVEYPLENMAWGVGVGSTIGSGKIARIDSSAAEEMPGVLAVLHHGNTEKLFRAANSFEEGSRPGESRPPFEDDQVYYYGQFVALVVADTFERAQAAAEHVAIGYDARTPDVSTGKLTPQGPPAVKNERGNVDDALSGAPIQLDVTYETPVETHNPMEMHATIAHWAKDKLTLYETSQGVEPSQRSGGNVEYSARIGAGDFEIYRIRIWIEVVSMAAFVDGRDGVETAQAARQGIRAAQHDVYDRRASAVHAATHPLRRGARREVSGVPARDFAAHFHGGRLRGELRGSNLYVVQLPERARRSTSHS